MAPITRGTTGNKQSARDVLEKIALEIYNQEKEKTIPYKNQLIGVLRNARFADALKIEHNLKSYGPSDSCSLDHLHHTNIYSGDKYRRIPCDGRNEKRFSNEGEAYCSIDKIRDNGIKSSGGTCAPFRRQNMCDKNLEFLDNDHTDDTDDLLGNVLVTAKYEGESIVNNHPNKKTSDVCTALARSFADIGDIVRGKDMFKRTDKDYVENGLREVFKKIHGKLNGAAISYYNADEKGNFYKLREAWWNVNRNKVWEAITCKAPKDAHYFLKSSPDFKSFSNPRCGHEQGNVPTYLDYVPQFLRWFEEWSEEFCRIRYHKLKRIKDACRNESKQLYCSHNGYDCTKSFGKLRKFCRESKCTKCSIECLGYENWIKDKKIEFEKQREKYESEINGNTSPQDDSNKNIYKGYNDKFYKDLEGEHGKIKSFLNLLNEGRYCKEQVEEKISLDFNSDVDKIFSRSEYCQVCPDCGVKCTNGRCKKKAETDDNCGKPPIYTIPTDVTPTDINVLYSGDEHGDIVKRLSTFCGATNYIGEKNELWKCYYNNKQKNNNDNICKLQPNAHIKNKNIIINFDNFIQFWVTSLLMDTTDWDRKLKTCINNNNNDGKCITECYENCTCFDKWVKKKEKEWKSVKKHITNEKENERKKYCDTLKKFFSDYYVHGIETIYKGKHKWKERIEKVEKIDCSKVKIGTEDSQDQIDIFLGHLKEDANQCTTKNPHSACDKPKADRIITPATTRNPCGASIEKSGKTESVEEVCKEVERYITDNNGKTYKHDRCNTKEDGNWNGSTTQIDRNHIGAHMPPRRKSLCIRELRYLVEIGEDRSIDYYKNAFTKCASIETYLLWQKYKKSNRSEEDKIKGGEIPEDFRRIMYYTFGDYRDIFFGTDISKDVNIKNISKKIKALIEENDSKATGGKGENLNSNIQSSWDEHKIDIWKGMLCGLTYDIQDEKQKVGIRKMLYNKYNYPCDLELFASKPQFLRWFIEWSEDYCRNYRKELDILQKACSEVDCKVKDKQKKKECKTACENFNKFVNIWKDQYRKQKDKFDSEKKKKENEGTYKDLGNKEAYEYLKDKCLGRKCGCIGSLSTDIINKSENIPSGFDTPPNDYIGKCSCAPNESACNNDELPKGRSEHQMECEDLNNNGDSDRTTILEIKKKDLVGEHSRLQIVNFKPMYFPTRVKQLCLKNLEKLTSSVDESKFVKELQKDAYNEAKQLYKYYEKDGKDFIYTTDTKDAHKDIRKHTIENMKRSYADYADLIKGKTKYKLYDKYNHINSIIERVVNSDSSAYGNENKREKLWEKYRADVWNAMLCGYKEASKSVNVEQNACELPETEETDQFIRWFTEWAENFCIYKKREVAKMEESCNFTDCNKALDEDKIKCHTLCKKYKNWIKEKQHQYQNQKKIYEHNYKAINNNNKDAHEFLKDECKNRCDCISNNTSGDNNDNVFEEYPENSEKACKCPPVPGSSNKGSPFGDIFNIKNVIKKRPCPKNDSTDINRHSEENEYGTKSKNSTLSHMSCVEKAAYKMKEFDEKNIQDIYDKTIIQKDGFKEIDKEELKKTFSSNNYSCENENIKRFEIEQKWMCGNINRKHLNICLPPRRQHICIKRIKQMSRRDIISTDDLLKEVMEAAKDEGIDILKKLKTERSTQFYKICDAMKYSFADIGDIIRGKDMWDNNHNEDGLQVRLKNIFWNIYSKLESKEKKKYENDLAYFYKLRSDWWNANRKEIWKAMTCVAPENAYIIKRRFDGGDIENLILTHPKCGHDTDPPVVDYIPQRLRWMSEWSEYFCNVLNKEIDEMNNQCKDCEMSRRCNNDTEGEKCKKCKEQCQIFKELVSKWKNEFDKQSMKYKELYIKASTNITKQNSSAPERGYRRNHRRRGYDDDTNVQLFLKKVIENNECKVESLGKYLDKTSHCGNYNFNYDNTPGSNRSNAFEIPPEKFKKACKCKIPNPLEKCPNEENKNVCTRFDKVSSCTSLSFKNDLSEWNNSGVKNKENDNNGVLVPPRRRNLCINLFSKKDYKMKDENDFKEDLLNAAFSQGKLLGKKYSNYSNEAYEAMKFSYADYSDIVKGTDMMNDLKKLNKELNTLLKETEKGDISVDRKTWWDDNKNVVWNAMLCGYKTENENQQLNSSWCNVPDDDNIDQFLRWLTEWAQQYCKEKLIKAHIINTKCKDIVEGRKHKSMVDITDVECKRLFIDYEEWFRYRYNQWKGLSEKYIKIKKSKNSGVNIPSEECAASYVTKHCNGCICNLRDMEDIHKNINNQNELMKEMINIIKFDTDQYRTQLQNISNSMEINPKSVKTAVDTTKDIVSYGLAGTMGVAAIGLQAGDFLGKKIQDLYNEFMKPVEKKLDTSSKNLNIYEDPNIMVPAGIGVALTLGLLLFKMRTKPKHEVDIIRILQMSQNKYGIPTTKSPNKYIPYASQRYKGKTYLYVEGDTSGDEDKYIGDISSSDITSSESEYEELDINDIYVPGSPKYKTLIEVVLEPSGNNTTASGNNTPSDTQNDIHNDIPSDIPNSDTPPPITDEEWNELKNDFISQYLPNAEPNNNYRNGNVPMNTQPNTLYFDKPDEKPFITSIHDRNLYTGEEISYNIHMSTNTNNDIPKYVSNNVYSGIDLINDTLSGNKHIDIYDEVLKRKENELFGTNYKKNTSNNSVAKELCGDPIMNQLDLLHKWLDRHRDMCNTWNTKEELLDKLKEEWNKDNDGGDIPNDNKKLNTDVSIQIDMDETKGKKEFSNMDTILDNIEDDIYYDVNDDENPFVDDIPMDHNKVDVPKKVHVEMKILNNTSNGTLEPEFPISDVWDI
ncbi:erythrocyte membrane protein 1 [Plasmodium falciparum RAJ116]|uniref:Erythrocyte membrane protein 1 n=2 Tax=Plasmodium falciparum TaxID=5833 RepID=A0A0L0CRL5_PLAFA|nr:erythrocyte membrane protein 1 [Plasmodium falciparum RAJ116]